MRVLYEQAVEALDRLYFSRTGRSYTAAAPATIDAERIALLKRRILQEKIVPFFLPIFRRNLKNGQAECDAIAAAVITTAEMCLNTPEGEPLRRTIADLEDCSAYYEIDTNAMLPVGDEDLFQLLQSKERRILWDKNLRLPSAIDNKHAFIVGQTFDHEDDFWLRNEVRNGNENLYSFGVTDLLGVPRLQIQRLRGHVVSARYKNRKRIPAAAAHYSADSRLEEVANVLELFRMGPSILEREIAQRRLSCVGNYNNSIFVARRCSALLLHESGPELSRKVDEEWDKFLSNHPNVLGDTQLVQNALYLNAEIFTNDSGAKKMAAYCGLKWSSLY